MSERTTGRILVVDDDATARLLVERVLKKAGHDLVILESATDAVAAFAGPAFEVVMSDKNLDGADGLELLSAARAQWPHVQTILITGDVSASLKARALERGIGAVLEKPFTLTELKGAVERALAAARARG